MEIIILILLLFSFLPLLGVQMTHVYKVEHTKILLYISSTGVIQTIFFLFCLFNEFVPGYVYFTKKNTNSL